MRVRVRADLGRGVPFELLLDELVSNACKHAFPLGAGGALFDSSRGTTVDVPVPLESTGNRTRT